MFCPCSQAHESPNALSASFSSDNDASEWSNSALSWETMVAMIAEENAERVRASNHERLGQWAQLSREAACQIVAAYSHMVSCALDGVNGQRKGAMAAGAQGWSQQLQSQLEAALMEAANKFLRLANGRDARGRLG